MLRDIVLLFFYNASVRLSSLLKVLHRLAHFFGKFLCFSEGRRFLQPNGTMHFPRRNPTGEKRHQVALRHTCPACQLRHLFRALFDDLAFTLTQGVDALD
ncbi:hypothetical protein T01_13698 [Trichinella spiralis]|uniref:Uncharacterized protein n=1 Tax=Trichinella spiralis TaxID=6334 RepID=A0A0V0Z3Y6_TRISP|nr:hypothetical protein T01_13698 [Trichinella spiralis]